MINHRPHHKPISHTSINEWNTLSMGCVTASSLNMFKNKVDTSQEGGLHIDEHC